MSNPNAIGSSIGVTEDDAADETSKTEATDSVRVDRESEEAGDKHSTIAKTCKSPESASTTSRMINTPQTQTW